MNKDLCILYVLKDYNRLESHKEKVQEIKQMYGSLCKIAEESSMNCKNINKLYKETNATFLKSSTKKYQDHKEVVIDFAMQEHISSPYPSVKFAGKRFLLQTIDEMYNKYLTKTQFYANRRVSCATFARYIQKEFYPMAKIPQTEARCETDNNVQFCIDALSNVKMEGISGSRYKIVKETLCKATIQMSDSYHKFCDRTYYERKCPLCGVTIW